MRQAFFLAVLLIGVIAAMFVLKRKAETGRATQGLAPKDTNAVNAPTGAISPSGIIPAQNSFRGDAMRVVALTRLLPSYAVELPAQEPQALREQVLRHLVASGGRVLGALPGDPRAPFPAEVPHAAFKKLLRDLGLGTRTLRVIPVGDKVHRGGPALVSLTLSLPAPGAPPGIGPASHSGAPSTAPAK